MHDGADQGETEESRYDPDAAQPRQNWPQKTVRQQSQGTGP